ncbi:MAG: hypothetical protein GY755_03035 [Chloroflexi bacterium]|nr:hypothetical protein [Chloroflexota bacterium]
MSTPEKDQKYLESALPELKKYLLSDTLFYPMGQLPRLTIGGLLLAQKRLQAGNRGTHLFPELDSVKQKWYAAWTKKAAREQESRLTLWRNYLNDYQNRPTEYAADYPNEVRWRVMLELLIAETDEIPPELTALDKLLRAKLKKSNFIWDESLQSEFDEEKFWFLYGKL